MYIYTRNSSRDPREIYFYLPWRVAAIIYLPLHLPAGERDGTDGNSPHPPRAGRHGTDFPRPRVSLLAFVSSRPGRVRLHTQRGRGSRDGGRGDWPADGWGKPGNGVIIGRGDLLDRTSSKLRRIDRINLPPRRNIEGEKARGGGCGLTRRRTRHKYDLAGPRSTNWELFGRNRDGERPANLSAELSVETSKRSGGGRSGKA